MGLEKKRVEEWTAGEKSGWGRSTKFAAPGFASLGFDQFGLASALGRRFWHHAKTGNSLLVLARPCCLQKRLRTYTSYENRRKQYFTTHENVLPTRNILLIFSSISTFWLNSQFSEALYGLTAREIDVKSKPTKPQAMAAKRAREIDVKSKPTKPQARAAKRVSSLLVAAVVHNAVRFAWK